MNTIVALLITWFWAAMGPLTAIEANAGPAVSPPPPACAASPSSSGAEAASACKAGSQAPAAPPRGASIYNGI